jgi:hypothetical protein
MQFIKGFIECFFKPYTLGSVSENDNEFYISISASKLLFLDINNIQQNYNFLQPNDQFSFTVVFGNNDPISFYSANANITAFITSLESAYKFLEDAPIKASITISKGNNNNSISIYDLSVFTETLKQLSVSEAYTIFNRVLSNSYVNFCVLNLDKSFGSANIRFISIEETQTITKNTDRQKRLDNILSVSNYTNLSEHKLTPDDFKLSSSNPKYTTLCSLFDEYKIILSVIYLFDITSLTGNELEFKINGYKSFKGKVDLKEQKFSTSNQYYEIYNWVYNGGNLQDKIGLARNIISLHFAQSGEFQLKGHPYQSILSSYKVYEKQNIRQYIEIRNKISDQLLDFNNRANKVIETFASGFQKNAMALITFYFSAVAIKVLGNGDFVNVFTLDTTVLSSVFLTGSFLYYRVAKWEVEEQKKRFIASYTNLKERYADLLDNAVTEVQLICFDL